MENKVTITVALFGEDSSFDKRRRFRDAIHSALEQAQLGSYVGGGSMVTDEPNYGIEFDIVDDGQAVTLVRDTLRAAGVGTSAEIRFGRDRRYNVYDDSWTDLGPRPASPQPPAASTAASAPPPSRSPQDLLAQLTQLTEEARKKYGGPKDPNRGA